LAGEDFDRELAAVLAGHGPLHALDDGGAEAAVVFELLGAVVDADANERAVRNWFEARNAPNGENLVILMGRSDEVLEVVLQLAGRQELVTARRLSGARDKLREMLALMDDLQS